MSTVHRLRLAGAVLSLAGVIVCSQVWGDASRKSRPLQAVRGGKDNPPVIGNFSEGLAAAKFAKHPVVSYTTRSGERLFGAQLKPVIPPVEARPRDVLVLFDTSASQAGTPYVTARKILEGMAKSLAANDQIDVWTLNIPAASRSLTGGFQNGKSEKVADAIRKLENSEYASGLCDLKGTLRKAIKEFDIQSGRQPLVVLLGDGESAYDPVTTAQRYEIAQELVDQKIAFFAVPLGLQLNPMNLHGFASTTGGAIVRLFPGEKPEEFGSRLLGAVSAPILYPTRFTLAEGAIEAYPTKLPPLRGDSPTLMVGKLKGTDTLSLTIEGSVAGKETSVVVREKLGDSENENFFLVSMVDQWSKAASKSAPALIRADRALAYAYQQTKLTHEEYITQAHWALSEDRIDVADKLFGLAAKVDPYDVEAVNGLAVVKKLKDGSLTRKQLLAEFNAAKAKTDKMDAPFQSERADRIDLAKLLASAQDSPAAGGPGAAAPAPAQPSGDDLLKYAQQQRRLVEQQTEDSVDRSIKNAKQELSRNPDLAYELLKRQLETVQNNVGIGEKVKDRLSNQLQSQLRYVELEGRKIKLKLEQEEKQKILAAKDAERNARAEMQVEKTRERIRAFVSLMNKARYDEAYKEANLLREESINKGEPVPIEATASYAISLNAMNLKELNELKRIREERFLLTLMQVEKSHIPYPDEPPVHFPPAATWKELTKLRNKYYDYYSLGFRKSPNFAKVIKRLNEPYGAGVDREVELPLDKWFDQFNSKLEATGFYILPNMKALKAADNPIDDLTSKPSKIPPMPGATFGTVMAMVLSNFDLSYFVNQDHIEITTKKMARKDFNHALRVYEVADLVIPIPSAINTMGVGQTLAVLGGAFSFGSAGSPFNAFGNGGFQAIGGFAGFGIGGVGIGGVGIGGMAGMGMAGMGGMAMGGGMAGMGGMAMGGAPNFGGGAGGGFLGFGGGQAGQLGNLGGQFGFQGQTFENHLVRLITDTIARGHWARVPANLQVGQMGGGGDPMMDDDQVLIPADEKFSLGFYPPALALVVSAPSRYRPTVQYPREGSTGAAGGMGALPPQGGNALVKQDDGKKPAKKDPAMLAKVKEEYAKGAARKDPKPIDWQKALADSDIPNEMRGKMLLATVDFLGQVKEFGHAADLLKASLRLGIANDPWVFDALAIALDEIKGSPADVERAKLSAIDLNPKDPATYLRGAAAMHEAGHMERAVEFCRRAAELAPNQPDSYANALVYLEKEKTVDTDAVQWAVSNLLSRDWIADKDLYYDQAHEALDQAKARLLAQNRQADARKIQNSVTEQQHRDLIVELAWQDAADLDLVVHEPINTVCSSTQRQTPAGSMLVCDDLRERKETYTVAEAYSGTYVIKVNRVWGRPLGGKAQIKVTKHGGTPEQVIEYHTISVDRSDEVKVTLTGGRRTHLATVVLPVVHGHPDKEKIGAGLSQAIERLRLLADPTYRNDLAVRSGGVGAASAQPNTVYDMTNTPKGTAKFSYQTKVEGEAIGVDLTAKIEVTNNGEAKFKIVPAFDTINSLQGTPRITNPLIPGGN